MNAVHGLADPLVITDSTGWIPATRLVEGDQLSALLDAARLRWDATPQAATTLAWKAYSYWVAMPAVLSWATARRVPLVDAEHILVRFAATTPLLYVGLSRPQLAVLTHDSLAHSGRPDVTVVSSEHTLLTMLRTSLLDQHLYPLAARIQTQVKVSRRALLGSVASGISYALIHARHTLIGSAIDDATTILDALDLSGLVELIPSGTDTPQVRRRTCCLAFTLPQSKICTSCCISRHGGP
ncbi:hypothetical protein [Catellatospora sichuanensis]|uniref:hypothetical protein n=1 Tax=Catellatospora sichuanensis TaxID=1969805 RepID=UPI0011840AB2|nr:hypothetical protein [Catellatospora sichuanensis]